MEKGFQKKKSRGRQSIRGSDVSCRFSGPSVPGPSRSSADVEADMGGLPPDSAGGRARGAVRPDARNGTAPSGMVSLPWVPLCQLALL